MEFSIEPYASLHYEIAPAAANPYQMGALWEQLRQAWLESSYQRSQSNGTLLAYKGSSAMWLAYLAERGVEPWQVTTVHVRAWQSHLRTVGNSGSTINLRLASVSSWYHFVCNEVYLVDGIERSAFADATGHTRANPFKAGNLRRAKVSPYGKARPIAPVDIARLFEHLEAKRTSLTGSRNYALLMSYFLTAARNREIVQMRWGDIRPSRSQPGSYIYAWRGKGNKTADSALPTRAYEAIKAHLEIAERWEPEPDEHIWTPLVRHGSRNLASNEHHSTNRGHISEKNAVRIFHTAMRLAGVEGAEQYRVHDIRHTFAHLFRGDIETLRNILHHESLGTTGIYLHSLKDPVDDYSERIWGALRQ